MSGRLLDLTALRIALGSCRVISDEQKVIFCAVGVAYIVLCATRCVSARYVAIYYKFQLYRFGKLPTIKNTVMNDLKEVRKAKKYLVLKHIRLKR